MVHAVHFYDTDTDFAEGDRPSIALSITSPNWNTIRKEFWEYLEVNGGDLNAAHVVPDAELFEDLESYIAALNLEADWVETHSKKGASVTRLAEDMAHWAEIGVSTPEDLNAYLNGGFERETEEVRHAA